MTASPETRWLHRLAVLTACVALLPILMGALVTTKDAGMAFPDWPNSDGHSMLLYPWLKSAGAKFLEHGHRLAGVLIGLTSMALAAAAWQSESRRWVRYLAYSVLAAVVVQGILGGQRVRLDARGLAFVHGSFAALVLALMAGVAVVTSAGWRSAGSGSANRPSQGLQFLAFAASVCIFVQYVLGGLLRHRGMVLYEHLGFAFVAAVMAVWLAMSAAASGIAWLRRPAVGIALLTVAQLALGAGAWVTKFGFGGYVAVYGSLVQDVTRTAHVLCGMALFVTTIVLTVRIVRLRWLSPATGSKDLPSTTLGAPLPLAGGAG
jgi:cytochrome c oxidase assembly protein subunit 15